MGKRKVDVVLAGHMCLDIFPSFLESGKTKLHEIFTPGKLINVGNLTVSTGGPVSNTGIPLLKLGLKTEFVGKVGDDLFGRAVIERFKKLGTEKGIRVVKGEQSAYTIVIAPPNIDRMFLHNPGANDTFGFEDIEFNLVKDSKIFHLGYPPLMKRLYIKDGRELVKIFKRVKELGVTASLDVALPDPASPAGKVNWDSILKKTLPYVDIFLPSAEESLFMLDREKFMDMRAKSAGRDMLGLFVMKDLSWIAEKLLHYGVAIAGIKCGYKGLYLRTSSEVRLKRLGAAMPEDPACWANRQLWQPAFKVKKFVSAAGAGDNCIAGFLAAYLKGESPESALRYACALGAQNVQVMDTTSGVKSWNETTARLKKGWVTNRYMTGQAGYL